MPELKTQQNGASVEEFLSSVSDETRRSDCRAVSKIMQEVTGEPPKMWGSSIVGFGTYKYKYASGREGEWMLTGFSPRKNNLTLYIMPGFDEYADYSGYDPSGLLKKLGPHSTGKSCLYIKKLEDIDLKILRQIIAGSVKQMGSSRT